MVDTGWEPKKDNLRGCFMDDFQEDGNLLWYSYLENPMDGGAWWATVHGVTKSQTWLSDFTFIFFQEEVWHHNWNLKMQSI